MVWLPSNEHEILYAFSFKYMHVGTYLTKVTNQYSKAQELARTTVTVKLNLWPKIMATRINQVNIQLLI